MKSWDSVQVFPLDILVMSKLKVLICAATHFELLPVVQFLEKHKHEVVACKTLEHGVGLPASIFSLTRYLSANSIDLVLQIGLAGSLDPAIAPGDVVHVVEEHFMDLGAEEKDGSYISLFDLGLNERDAPPFSNGKIDIDPAANFSPLPKVKGGTVNLVSGSEASIAHIRKAFPMVQVESMEGGAAAYVCKSLGVPLIQVRAISNMVEPRNRGGWAIEKAMSNLSEVVVSMLQEIMSIHAES